MCSRTSREMAMKVRIVRCRGVVKERTFDEFEAGVGSNSDFTGKSDRGSTVPGLKPMPPQLRADGVIDS